MRISPGWSTLSMIMYIVLGLYAVAIIHFVQKRRIVTNKKIKFWNIYYISIIIIWDVVASFRYVGNRIGGADSSGYIYYFKNCLKMTSDHYEPMYKLINMVIRFFVSDYHVFYLICYGFIICAFLLFVDEFMTSRTSTIPFVLLMFELWRGFNTFRTTLAIAFILCGLVLLNKGKNKSAIIVTVMGCLVHISTILYAMYIPVYYLYSKKKLKIKHVIIASVFSYIASVVIQTFLLTSGSFLVDALNTGATLGYIGHNKGMSFFEYNPITIEHSLLFIFVLLFRKRIKKNFSERTDEEQTKLKMLLLICFFDFLTIPINFTLHIWRGYEIFYVPRLVMWGELVSIFSERFNFKSRRIISVLFIIAFTGWLVFRFYNMWESSQLMPYVFEPFVG